MSLVEYLIEKNCLKTQEIIEAFKNVKRRDFLPPEIKNLSEIDEALPIGYGQTISQPQVVAFMLELLQPKEGEKILDVGAGSGWTTALLSWIVSKGKQKEGKVIAIERIPELVAFSQKNVSKYNFIKKKIAKIILGDGTKGYIHEAPFDKILCSAEAQTLPQSWKDQLKVGGRIVTPLGSSIWVFVKKTSNEFESEEYPGFAFVPLLSN